jgi:H+/Cl- antiporter ClcA
MQLALSDGLGFPMVAILLVLKMVVILAVLRGGAEGGLLTPGLAVGGLAACCSARSGSRASRRR